MTPQQSIPHDSAHRSQPNSFLHWAGCWQRLARLGLSLLLALLMYVPLASVPAVYAAPGISITPTSGLVTTETGGTAYFTVVLNERPSANVTINLSSSNTAEGTVSAASLLFTQANWSVPQIVTVTGVDDSVDDNDAAYSIVTTTSSSDASYSAINPPDVSLTNTDNDTRGITVSGISGNTSEPNTTATFTIRLNSQPTANVSIGLSSSNTAEGTVSPAALNFTTGNWNTPQTVTVTGVDDLINDGDIAYSIVTAAASGGDYAGVNAADVNLFNRDNDGPGIIVSNISTNTTEAGAGTATFTIRLNTTPGGTHTVVVNLSSSDTSEGTVSPASVTFDSSNFGTNQIVTVTGVDDNIDDGDIAYTIITDPSTGVGAYNNRNAADVPVANIDNDSAGISVSTPASSSTTEAAPGSPRTFTVVLTSQPASNVVVPLGSSDTTEGTVSPPSLTFTTSNWHIAQTVTVTGVDDSVADGNIPYTIVTGPASSSDPVYKLMNPADRNFTNTDNDSAGITVSAISGDTTESGGTATFSVVLTSQPVDDVTIDLSSSNTAEGTVSPSSLTFTSDNWNTPQQVTVTGVDDDVDDGDVAYSVVTAAASFDPAYSGMAVADVPVMNLDDDTAGITVSAASGNTSEAGTTATFTVQLTSQPTATVTIGLSSSDTTEGTVSPALLTFTTSNWNDPQTVTVTGVDDLLDDGDIAYTIVTEPAVSDDPLYSGRNANDVSLSNTDNDGPGFLVSNISGNTTEAGGSASFTVQLNSPPAAGTEVTIGLSSSDTTEGTITSTLLTFTSANWNQTQTVTVTGVNDDVDDGDISYSIQFGASSSSDPAYNNQNPADVLVVNADDDTAGFLVSNISGNTSEAGGTASFTVRLTSQPTATVTIDLNSSDTTEGTVTATPLTFTTSNWSTPQQVTVTGVNDDVDDGDVAYSIVTDPASSDDPNYDSLNPSDVAVINLDNDVAGIGVSPISGNTTEAGGTASFTVRLNSQPAANVTIGLSSSDTTEGTVSPASLTFTPATWNTPKIVTVKGVDDAIDDNNITYKIVTAPATSSDPNYSLLNAADVSVVNLDNDTAGITVSAISGNTTEAGGTASFTVRLNSQPIANVTIGLSSSDTTEGTVSPASLTFTPANWSTPKTVTVKGVDDAVADGNITYKIITSATSSSDAAYNGLAVADVTVMNNDNDQASAGRRFIYLPIIRR